jgi:hypothetical protein
MMRLQTTDVLRKSQQKLVLCSLPQAAHAVLSSGDDIFTHQTILNVVFTSRLCKISFDIDWPIIKWARTRASQKRHVIHKHWNSEGHIPAGMFFTHVR